ncbi:MAG: 30S ribosomal protein S14 [Bacteroidetes bacterium SW_11_45_7]|nr:MAG: 30S ribosomal protein S14 [Bacteroidetes bacterium SW_11_45_7]
MAKKSQVARQKKRERMVKKYAEKRKQLKKEGRYDELDKLPKNASPVRLRNRCSLTGRSNGYVRDFGISRVKFRQLAHQGLIPGMKKASW